MFDVLCLMRKVDTQFQRPMLILIILIRLNFLLRGMFRYCILVAFLGRRRLFLCFHVSF